MQGSNDKRKAADHRLLNRCADLTLQKNTALAAAFQDIVTDIWNCTLQVDGLRCAACGARLKQALLAQVGGVRRADVEFVSGRVEVHGQAISKDTLLGYISGLGYTARVIEFQEEPPGIVAEEEL